MTNNFKQSVLGWLQYGLTKDKEFKRKAILYTYTVISFSWAWYSERGRSVSSASTAPM